MKLGRCPVCHSHIQLDALIQDEAGRQLLGLMSKLGYQMAPALVSYLGLFRPAKQDLSNGRALNLAQETLALTSNQPLLAEALRETVQSIHNKRHQGENKAAGQSQLSETGVGSQGASAGCQPFDQYRTEATAPAVSRGRPQII